MSIDIVNENAQTSGRETWNNLLVSQAGDMLVAGFTRQPSTNVGGTVQFCVTGGASVINIYRFGWYGGSHAWRLIDTITNTPTSQPAATTIPDSNGGTTCTGWSVTAEWDVPVGTVSGMFSALVVSIPPQAPNGFHIPFVIRDDAAVADIIYKTSDSTWGMAYNFYGTPGSPTSGKNVYGSGQGLGTITARCHAVSNHRPIITRYDLPQTYWWGCEAPMIRWLERNGYSVKYISSIDLDRTPSILDNGSIFVSNGHDEYWSVDMRDNFESYRDDDAGRSIFWSGNEVFWRTRFVYSGDEATMWCYKDTMAGPGGHAAGAPLDPVSWTGTWKDTRWAQRKPEWLATGTDFRLNGINDLNAIVPTDYAEHPVWRNTTLSGGAITLTDVVGFEADAIRPTQNPGQYSILMSYTQNIDDNYADDNGQVYSGDGDLEWGAVAQGYSGGGFTVGFGTCQWSWALDTTHDRVGGAVSTAAQQVTVNLLRDMGAAPGSIQGDLTLSAAVALTEYGLIEITTPPPANGTPGNVYNAAGTQYAVYVMVDDELLPLTPV